MEVLFGVQRLGKVICTHSSSFKIRVRQAMSFNLAIGSMPIPQMAKLFGKPLTFFAISKESRDVLDSARGPIYY